MTLLTVRIGIALALLALTSSAHAAIPEEISKLRGSICGPAMKGLGDVAEENNRKAVFVDRFLAPWVEIEKVLQAPLPPDDVAARLKRSDFRGKFFQAVELLKFYSDYFKDTRYRRPLEELTKKINRLEDQVGFAIDADHIVRNLEKIGADPRAIQYAKDRAAKGLKKLTKTLKEEQWLGADSPTLKNMVALYDKMDYPSQPKDTDYLEKEIRQHIRKITSVSWDMSILEEHLHKFRRLIRKLSILKIASRGKIQTTEGLQVLPSMAPFQEVAQESRRYLDHVESPFHIKYPVYFYEAAENTLANAIETFGNLKDRGELYLLSMEALVESGAFGMDRRKALAAADAWLRPRLAERFGWKPYLEDAKIEFQRYFVESKFLEKLLIPRPDKYEY